jgi:hypothetical protein
MKLILAERGISIARLKAQCKYLQFIETAVSYCTRRILWNPLDFVKTKSRLEEYCETRGSNVLFLLNFHRELIFVEQCWEAAKRTYRLGPTSSAANLGKSKLETLDSFVHEGVSLMCFLISCICSNFAGFRRVFVAS